MESRLLVRVKRVHKDAVIPKYSKKGDAGMDLTAVGKVEFNAITGIATYHTGLAVEIPEGYVGYIYPRSSITKVGCRISNCVGVIDSGYRGEVVVKMDLSPQVVLAITGSVPRISEQIPPYRMGDRIAQLVIMPYPKVQFVEVEDLSNTDRGEGGFGSTGK